MICIHKQTKEIGIIEKELNSVYPPQYGIHWNIKYENHTISHYYWTDKNLITIITKDNVLNLISPLLLELIIDAL